MEKIQDLTPTVNRKEKDEKLKLSPNDSTLDVNQLKPGWKQR
jgi:hypothetical protein